MRWKFFESSWILHKLMVLTEKVITVG